MTDVLRIGIVLKGNDGWMGGLEYMKNLVIAAREAANEGGRGIDVSMISSQTVNSGFAQQVGYPLNWIQIPSGMPTVRFARIRRLFQGSATERPIDLAVRSANVDFVYPVDSLSRSVSCRRLAWIPDLQHRVSPEFSSKDELRAREDWIETMIRDAPGIVFSSCTARSHFETHYPTAGSKLHVLPFRVRIPNETWTRDPDSAVRHYHLPARFLLVSNQFWKHKNHLLLFEAIRIAKMRVPGLLVVMTGALHDYRHPDYPDLCLRKVHELGISQNVRILGLIPKSDQIQLLRACIAIVQASLFEGWSTIVEEARLVGKPMLLSDLPVHREQGYAKARYFNPSDSEALAELLMESWTVGDAGSCCIERQNSERQNYTQLFLEFGARFLELATEAGAFSAITPPLK